MIVSLAAKAAKEVFLYTTQYLHFFINTMRRQLNRHCGTLLIKRLKIFVAISVALVLGINLNILPSKILSYNAKYGGLRENKKQIRNKIVAAQVNLAEVYDKNPF